MKFNLSTCVAIGVTVTAITTGNTATATRKSTVARPIPLSFIAQGVKVEGARLGVLATGGRQIYTFTLPRAGGLDLRVPFAAAPFNGTQLNARINGFRLVPYFAFGGDTRYNNVKGKPGMRPPAATIEGRWLIAPSMVRQGSNDLELWTTGITPNATLERIGPRPRVAISAIRLRPADGASWPQYANSVYYDFNLWAQGYEWGHDADRRFRYEQALLGILNGQGMNAIVPSLGGSEASLWATKRTCENNYLDWGMKHQEFYTIWEFSGKPGQWAKFVDVDKNPDTQTKFHSQTVDDNLQSRPELKGADVVLFDKEKYVRALEPAIKALAPYTDFYNFKCEQRSLKSHGFGFKGDLWEKYGVTGDDWASNWWEAAHAAHELVRKYNPERGRVQQMNFWAPELRHYLLDHGLRRNQPMGEADDIMMNHFGFIGFYNYTKDGKLDADNIQPELQYPGGNFDRSRLSYKAFWSALRDWRSLQNTAFPELAIDFNRYRLSRTEADMKLADPKTHRWADGRPFDYRAGYRGDEMMYNSENGIWTGYSAVSPYQYLQGFLSYSLLPTGAGEPRDLKITTRQSAAETKDLPVNLYGHWIDGAGHTKRLRTVDPLYGDMFGWTGDEHCNAGDYISMVGIKDPHHRHRPNDAYNLVRRACYAFVTTGPVVPAYLGPHHDDSLSVKTLQQTFEGKRYIGVYAANFDSKPHRLDLRVPLNLRQPVEAKLFDDRAWDWDRSARSVSLAAGKETACQSEVPALSAWLLLIPMPDGGLSRIAGLPASPYVTAPNDAAVTDALPTLTWVPRPGNERLFQVEIAREALFRTQDRVELSGLLNETRYTMKFAPNEKWRYFWRVRTISTRGKGEWSVPRSFVYRWPEYSKAYPPQSVATAASPPPATPEPEWQRLATLAGLEHDDNLAWDAEIFATAGWLHAPSRAVDMQAFSYWDNGEGEDNVKYPLPAEWSLIWPAPRRASHLTILWLEGKQPAEMIVQTSADGKTWTDVSRSNPGAELLTNVRFDSPVTTKFLRLYFPKATSTDGQIGIREVAVK